MLSKSDKIKYLVYLNFGILAAATIYIIYISLELVGASVPWDGRASVSKVLIYIVVSWTLVFIISVVINVILLQGVIQRNSTKCLIWLIICALGTIYHVNKIVWSFLQFQYLQGVYLLVWVLLNLYSMYLVKSYMKELKYDSALQPLTTAKD